MKQKLWVRLLVYTLLAIVAFAAFFPVFWAITMSFKTAGDWYAFPPVLISWPPNFLNWSWLYPPAFAGINIAATDYVTKLYVGYAELLDIPQHFLPNSIEAATTSTAICLTFSLLAAYSLSRFRFKGRRGIAFGILFTRLLPPISLAIPIFFLFSDWHIIDTVFGLVLVYSSFQIPFSTWMLKGFLDQIPRELDEVGRLDGLGTLGVIRKVIVPLAAPGLAATGIFAFIQAWNDFFFAWLLTSSVARTVPVALASYSQDYSTFYGPIAAIALFIMIPAIIVSLVMGRLIVKGLTLGAVKG